MSSPPPSEFRKRTNSLNKRKKKLLKRGRTISNQLSVINGHFRSIWNDYKSLFWFGEDDENSIRLVSREIFLEELESFDRSFDAILNNPENKNNNNALVNATEYYISDVLKLTRDRWKTMRLTWEKTRENDTRAEDEELNLYEGCQLFINQNKDADDSVINEKMESVISRSYELIELEEKFISEEEELINEFESIIELRKNLFKIAKNRFHR